MLSMSDIEMRLNCQEMGRVSWDELKRYFKNKHKRDDVALKYIDEENEEVSLSGDEDLMYAYEWIGSRTNSLYIFAKDPANGEIIESVRIDLNKPKEPLFVDAVVVPHNCIHSSKDYDLNNSSETPNWFNHGLEKFKEDILHEFDKRIDHVFKRFEMMHFSRDETATIQEDIKKIVKNLLIDLDKAFAAKSQERIKELNDKICALNAYNAQFVRDGNIPDGTKLRPNVTFIKSWLIRNTGKLRWNDVKLVNSAGGIIPLEKFVHVAPIDTNDVCEIQVELKAPNEPGEYYSEWILMCNNYKFGPKVWCRIEVKDNLIDLTSSAITSTKSSVFDKFDAESIDYSEFEDAQDDDVEFVIIPECFDLSKKWLPQSYQSVNMSGNSPRPSLSLTTQASVYEPQQALLESQMPSIQTLTEQSSTKQNELEQSKDKSFLMGAPKFNFNFEDDNFMRPLVEKVFETCKSESSMMRLVRMGFANRELNRKLLEKHSDDIEKVIEELVRDEDNDWAFNRH